MKNKSLVMAMFLAINVSLLPAAMADDDEMKTETKSTHRAVPALPADHSLRAKVRKKAPFWIADHSHGAALHLNKDGGKKPVKNRYHLN